MQCGEARRVRYTVSIMPADEAARQISLQSRALMFPFLSTLQEEPMTAQTIESVLHENRVFPPAEAFVRQANVSGMDAYRKLYAEAERDFTGFWGRLAQEHVLWHKPFTRVVDESGAPFFKWFDDGELNASYNCLDRHLQSQPDKTAIIFEADDGKVTRITYRELCRRVCQFANG